MCLNLSTTCTHIIMIHVSKLIMKSSFSKINDCISETQVSFVTDSRRFGICME